MVLCTLGMPYSLIYNMFVCFHAGVLGVCAILAKLPILRSTVPHLPTDHRLAAGLPGVPRVPRHRTERVSTGIDGIAARANVRLVALFSCSY